MKHSAAARSTTKLGHTLTPIKGLRNPRQEFLMASLGMSWQLAVVVLVPLFVGNWLDTHFKSLPLWTAIGFVLAMAGGALVVWRQLQLNSPKITKADIAAAKKIREREQKDEQEDEER